ncbi:MAG: DUF2752 domain-containing protein [Lawsonibacter sp.]|nr:DUF2752 domain-containing protein [Lawsonibacter sp.]
MKIKTEIRQKAFHWGTRHVLLFTFLVLDCILGCPIYRWFGVTCPGCGLTRAWLCFLSGDLHSALGYHLFFFVVPVFIVLFAHRNLLPKNRLLDWGLFAFALSLAVYHLGRVYVPLEIHD